MNKIKDLPANERPYEKCFEKGPQFLTDRELLAVILRTGSPGANAYELAGQILGLASNKQNLLSIMHLTKEELLSIKGVGMVKAVQIMCVGELSKRIASMHAEHHLNFDKPSSVADYYMEHMRHLEQEHMLVIYLDTKCCFIKEKNISSGTINQSLASPREIFIEGLNCKAVNIILLHNHPSGDSTPSRADVSSTLKIKKAGEIIGIHVIDHIIIGDKKYTSLQEAGIINFN